MLRLNIARINAAIAFGLAHHLALTNNRHSFKSNSEGFLGGGEGRSRMTTGLKMAGIRAYRRLSSENALFYKMSSHQEIKKNIIIDIIIITP